MSIQPTEFIHAIAVTAPWVLCAFLGFTLWRVKVKKRHSVLAYRALEERCRTITTLAAQTWPVLEPFRGTDYTTALGVIFREAKALNTVASMLDYPRPARNALDAKLLFDPIEAVKFAAAREGELKRVEECLLEFGVGSFRTITPANRVAELVGWLQKGASIPVRRGPDPTPNITYLARQLHDICRALEDADYPSVDPAGTVLQLLTTDRSVKPFPEGPLSKMQPGFALDAVMLEDRIKKLYAQLRRTIDACAPFAINVAFVDDLPMYVRTVLEQVRANEFTRGVNHAHRQQLEEKRGRKTKLAEVLIRAVGAGIIKAEQATQIGALAKEGESTGTVVTDGEAS